MLYQKHKSYKYVLPLKNWVDWITTRQGKISQSQKCLRNFEKKCPKIKKHISPYDWLPSITLLLR